MPEQHSLAFVDSISASANIRLSLQQGTAGPWNLRDGSRFDPPPLKRSIPQSLLADGGTPTNAVYDNRTIVLVLQPMQGGKFMTADPAAAQIQLLLRELDRPYNYLRYQAGTSSPVFFKTFRSGPDALEFGPLSREVTVTLLAEPFAYGLEETLSPVTVYNDPNEGTTLNSNPFFESVVSPWVANATGGSATFVRSTAQFHEGSASGLLTPDGVATGCDARSENVPYTPNTTLWASGWIRCAVARSIGLNINWRDAGSGLLSTSSTSLSVSANTWTFISLFASHASAVQAQVTFSMGSTPPASNTLFVDEARMRVPGTSGAMYLDIASPKGDVETPLFLTLAGTLGTGGSGQGSRQLGVSVRRRGTPSALPIVLQAESMTQGTDTSVQANSLLMSGSGSNFSRCTFVTGAMSTRLSGTWPPSPSVDARGIYRVFVRLRQNTLADVFDVRLQFGSSTVQVTNSDVRLPPDTGPSQPTLKYIDLGLMQVPVGYDPVTDGLSGVELAAQGLFVAVGARRVSGSGSVDFDCVLFVPTDDRGLLLVGLPEVQATPSDTYVVQGGAAVAMYIQNVSGQLVSGPQAVISGVGQMITPGRTNRVYVFRDLGTNVAQVGVGDDVTGSMTVTPSYWPRYIGAVRPVST